MAAEESTPTRKKDRLEFVEHVRVLVGPDKKAFTVHKDLITRRSSFFKAALADRWTSGPVQNNALELPIDDPETFCSYLHVAYQNEVVVLNDKQAAFAELVNLYILADKFGDAKTANLVIDEIMRYSDTINEIPAVEYLPNQFGEMPEQSPLRRLLVDYYVFEYNGEILAEEVDELPHSLLVEIVKKFGTLKKASGELPVEEVFRKDLAQTKPKCHYHQHNDTHPASDCPSKR